MAEGRSRILKNTLKNIIRNKWLSIATVLVTTIVFSTSSIFIVLSLLAQKAVQVTQTRPQIQVYFELETPQAEIAKVRESFGDIEGVTEVEYIDAETGAKLYLELFADLDDSEEFTKGVSPENIQESLTIKTDDLAKLDPIVDMVKKEERTNPYIEDVLYHKDFVDKLENISNQIQFGSIAIITLFLFVTIALIFITISFNIRSHKNEIEIMHLVGSADSYIKTPFILEGTFYSALGAIFAAFIIFTSYYFAIYRNISSQEYSLTKDMINYLDIGFLSNMSIGFIVILFGTHLIIGLLIGFISSYLAVQKHLHLKSK